MGNDWLSIISSLVVWVIIMALFTRWLARSRLRARPAAEACHLRYPPEIIYCAIVGVLFSVGMLAAAVFWSDGPVSLVVGSLFALGMSALCLSLVADYRHARHQVQAEGMAYGRMLGQRGMFLWSDVKRVNFSEGMNWYWIVLESGTTVRISGMLMGLPAFAAHVLEHVPAHRIDATARARLEAAVQGKLHKLWF